MSSSNEPVNDGETEKVPNQANGVDTQDGMVPDPASQPTQLPVQQPGQPSMAQPGQQPMLQPGQQPMLQQGQQPMLQPGQQPMQQPGQQQVTYYNMGQPGAVMMPTGQYTAPGVPMQAAPGMPMQAAPGMQMQAAPGMQMQTAPGVVMQQPGVPGMVQTVLMPAPQAIPGCPPGLEYLAQLDQLLIHQQIELAELVTNIDFENKYQIKNSMGQQVFFARESSDACMRICCGPARGFTISITDNFGQEVIRVSREFKFCAGCCWCSSPGSYCSFFIQVESPPGTVIGYVRQSISFASPHFDVVDANDQCILKIRGHWCRCQTVCCTDDINFKIFTNDLKNQVGRVSKQWGGWLRENITQADNFGVEFPADMDVKTKAILLASTFLIDFMFFEHKKNNKQNY